LKGNAMTAPSSSAEKKQPTHRAYHVKGDGDSAKWLELGAVWPHADGDGFDVVLDVVPVGGFSGRLTLRSIKPKKEPAA
jgi:hypothetical protein